MGCFHSANTGFSRSQTEITNLELKRLRGERRSGQHLVVTCCDQQSAVELMQTIVLREWVDQHQLTQVNEGRSTSKSIYGHWPSSRMATTFTVIPFDNRRGQRRKWLSHFECADAIIWAVDLSQFKMDDIQRLCR